MACDTEDMGERAVDAEHHPIVAREVTNVGTDRSQPAAMGGKARDARCEEVTVLADRGYYNGEEVLACEGTGVLPYVPKTQTSGNVKRGLFTVQDFISTPRTTATLARRASF